MHILYGPDLDSRLFNKTKYKDILVPMRRKAIHLPYSMAIVHSAVKSIVNSLF